MEFVKGNFLIGVACAMGLMSFTYKKTPNLSKGWLAFGAGYTICLLFLIRFVAGRREGRFFPPLAFIILEVGIALSYVLFTKKGDKFVVEGILLTVGLHFLPFATLSTTLLCGFLVLNSLYGFVNKEQEVFPTLYRDMAIKGIFGIALLLFSVI